MKRQILLLKRKTGSYLTILTLSIKLRVRTRAKAGSFKIDLWDKINSYSTALSPLFFGLGHYHGIRQT
jgi:hypothetical protein